MFFRRVLLPLIVAYVATSSVASEDLSPRALRFANHVDGAGCSLQLLSTASKGDVFQWDFNDEAWINLGGADLRLHLLSSRGMNLEEWVGSIGDKQVVTFSGKDVRVIVTMTLRSKCPASDESCEAVRVDGKVLVKTPKHSIVFRARGMCGT